MKTPAERGPYGRWLVAARLERELNTAEDARKSLAAAGINISKSTYAEYESGTKQPSKNHLPELERFFGAFKDPATTEAAADLATILTTQNDYLKRITAALEKLAGINPEDPEPQLSPGDSTVLRSLAKNWEAAPTTPRGDRPKEVAK